jgi:hypothetical protein
MKSFTNNNKATRFAREVQDRLCDLDSLLYMMDGEIPGEKADLAVKETRRHVCEALKTISMLTETTRDWYVREVEFAVNAHEMTADLQAKVDAIFTELSPTEQEYAAAAQFIACTRNTCGHRHESDWREMVNDEAARHGVDPLHLDKFACPKCGSVAKRHWTGCDSDQAPF